ncbi:MAG: aminoacyl-tRNA hydrolase [Myxococcota bacterium]
MFLISGLGNPGPRYERTRHNVGFEIIDALAHRFHFPPSKNEKKAHVSRARLGEHDVLLQKPTTFMNLSGEAVAPLARYYKIPPERVVVIHDELDFDPGTVRVKSGGGAGGNNGLKSIIQHFEPGFIRIRVGVGKPPSGRDGADHVLSKFRPDERTLIDEAIVVSCDIVESLLDKGLAHTMNVFNRKS